MASEHLPHSSAPVSDTRRRELTIGGLVLLGGALALVVPLSAQTLVHPVGFGLLVAWSVVAFAAAGVLWWRARPWSHIGPLLCVLGLALGLHAFQGSSSGVLLGVGVLADGLAVFLAWYVIVAFPGGRLDPAGRLLLAFGGGALLLTFVPKILLTANISGATPLARCDGGCPSNGLLIASDPGLADILGTVERWGMRVGFTLALVALLVTRFRRASPPRRRTLAAPYLGMGAWLAAFTAYTVAVNADASSLTLDRIGLEVTATRALFPLAFIAALVATRVHAGSSLQTMVHELRQDSSLGAVERTVRGVLEDPTARLALWLPDRRSFVDLDAHPVALPPAGEGTSGRVFESARGEPVLALVYDSALDEDPELLGAAGEAAVMTLENRRLDEELRLSREDLELSERRLASAVADERRRIERDLHDGSQQRLVAIRIGLELARERAAGDPQSSARLAKLGEELDRALEELRGAAQRAYPSVLADFGLTTALKAAADRSGVEICAELQAVPRLAPQVEAAIYFACVEALQNAAKHGGAGVRVDLQLWIEVDTLRFSVSDDGFGFAPARRNGGSGVQNMADRLAAVDGTFSLRSVPGGGCVASGSVPLAPPAPL